VIERDQSVGSVHVRLRSELTPARGTLGDRITWRLSATLGSGAVPGALLVEKPSRSLEVEGLRPPTQAPGKGGIVWSREYVLRGFDLGEIPLPGAALAVRVAGRPDTLEFPQDTLFVDSLTASATGSLRPDRGPLMPPLRPIDYIVAAAGALALALVVFFLVRSFLRSRRRARTVVAHAPPEPPEAVLDRALLALETELTALPRDRFYERLSLALRAYAAAVTQAPAPDLTTAELERELERHPRVLAEGRENLIATLRRADLAKFGRFEDEESEARSILRQARSISGRLIAPPEPEAVTTGARAMGAS
jgi:hypothetical protein